MCLCEDEVTHLLCVAGEGCLQLGSPGHCYYSVLHIVSLEQSLQNLAGTQRIHVRVGQEQHVLRGKGRWTLVIVMVLSN